MKLNRFDEAITWCDKGLAVSFSYKLFLQTFLFAWSINDDGDDDGGGDNGYDDDDDDDDDVMMMMMMMMMITHCPWLLNPPMS